MARTEVPIKVLMVGAAQEAVREFHKTFDPESLAEAPQMPSLESAQLRVRLMIEELDEVGAAMRLYYEGKQNAGDALVEVAQELADLLYVTYGTAITMGIELDPILQAVHEANMSKVWTTQEIEEHVFEPNSKIVGHTDGRWIVYRPDGKILKPPSYTKPDIADALLSAGLPVDAVEVTETLGGDLQ